MKVDEEQLRQQVERIRREASGLGDAGAFVAWYLWAGPAGDFDQAEAAVVDGPNDMGFDAVFSDNSHRVVYVVQGKYREKLQPQKSEPLGELNSFVDLAEILVTDDPEILTLFEESAHPAVVSAVRRARDDINAGFSVRMVYLTLRGCKAEFFRKAARRLSRIKSDASLEVVTGTSALQLLERYLIGMAPDVDDITLDIPDQSRIASGGPQLDIEGWVFPITGSKLVRHVEDAGVGIFAQNVRGFLGDANPVNDAMGATVENKPQHFLFYNNGVTMTCTSATPVGGSKLKLQDPQIINGQQTTRTLQLLKDELKDVRVLLRVIRIPKGSPRARQDLINELVEASNFQTPISKVDLKANDEVQVRIERELELLGYRYVRKRAGRSQSLYKGPRRRITVTREQLARAVADCKMPALSRIEGRAPLFDEHYEEVFGDFEPRYFLSCYWTARHVDRVATNYLRKQAKFLALYQVWSGVEEEALERRYQFEAVCKWAYPKYWQALLDMCDVAIMTVAASYKANPVIDDETKEARPYFQREEAFHHLEDYWSSRANAQRRHRFAAAQKRVLADLKEWQ